MSISESQQLQNRSSASSLISQQLGDIDSLAPVASAETPAASVSLSNITKSVLNSLPFASALVRLSDWSIAYVNQGLRRLCDTDAQTGNHHGANHGTDGWQPPSRLQDLFPSIGKRDLLSIRDSFATRSSDFRFTKSMPMKLSDISQVVELNLSLFEPSLNISAERDALPASFVLATIRPLSDIEAARVSYTPPKSSSISPLLASRGALHSSRYCDEFEELNCVGRGGFGSVYRVRNRIDGQEYAVKKLKLKSHGIENGSAINERLLREVQTFATISNHPNVVRYYAAWIESNGGARNNSNFERVAGNEGKQNNNYSDNSDSDAEIIRSSSNTFDKPPNIVYNYEDPSTTSGFDIEFLDELRSPEDCATQGSDVLFAKGTGVEGEPSKSEAVSSSPIPILARSGTDYEVSRVRRDQLPTSRSAPISNVVVKKRAKNKKKSSVPYAVLYIQMQFCPYSDLRKWIVHRGPAIELSSSLNLMRQIVEGVSFIHSRGFVHRDVTPANILVQNDGHVFLSDFGLSKSILAEQAVVTSASGDAEPFSPPPLPQQQSLPPERNHAPPPKAKESKNGTFLYTAPEARFTAKSDLYSIGIIMIELLLYFSTSMERAVVLTEARKSPSVLPQSLISDFPLQAASITKLLLHSTEDRLSAVELLRDIDLWTYGALPDSASSVGTAPSLFAGHHVDAHSRTDSYSSGGKHTNVVPYSRSCHSNQLFPIDGSPTRSDHSTHPVFSRRRTRSEHVKLRRWSSADSVSRAFIHEMSDDEGGDNVSSGASDAADKQKLTITDSGLGVSTLLQEVQYLKRELHEKNSMIEKLQKQIDNHHHLE